MKPKTERDEISKDSNATFIEPGFLENERNPTETIDLNSLFEPDVSVSGAFDLREVKTTSFGKLLEALPTPAMLLDWDGYVCFANSASVSIAQDGDLVGAHMTNLFRDEDTRSSVMDALDQVCVSRKPHILESQLGIGSRNIWARTHFRSMRIGRDRSILALVEDLTLERRQILINQKHAQELERKVQDRTVELSDAISRLESEIEDRKLAQAKLKNAALELRKFIDTANAPIFGIDVNGRITEWNQKAERITGYKLSEVQGRKLVDDFIASDHASSVAAVLDKALQGMGSENFEARLNTSDKKHVFVLLNATARMDAQNNIIGVWGVGQDVTDLISNRDRLEQMVQVRTKELRRSLKDTARAKDRIDGILRSVADGLIVTGNDHKVALMNKAAEDLLTARFEEVRGLPITSLVEDENLRTKLLANLNSPRPVSEFDCPLSEPGTDKLRILRARTSSIIDGNGKKQGQVTTLRDVTREREVDRLKTEFISTAAHELRTPLTSILGFSELLVNDDTIEQGEQVTYLTYINEQSHRLAKIIDELLDISRIESGRGFKLTKTGLRAPDFVMKLEPIIRETYKENIFTFERDGDALELDGDRAKIEQAIFNVVNNAVKYSAPGSSVGVSCRTDPEKATITISDNGKGMTADQVDQIFDKFYRGEYSNTAVEGVGLGMTIVKHIMEAHDGKVVAESEPGRGTRVTLTLPAKNACSALAFQ